MAIKKFKLYTHMDDVAVYEDEDGKFQIKAHAGKEVEEIDKEERNRIINQLEVDYQIKFER